VGKDAVRIALYSHDALGLGHLRRNLAIARSLTRHGASTLLVTGIREAGAFPAPDGVDYLVLPGYAKDGSHEYRPRFLNVTAQRLAALRADTMRAALEAFAPDVLIVDKHPLGLDGELEPALDALHEQGTRCVLGLRDVLDRPDRVRTAWVAERAEEAVREHYAQVWIYGDPRVYDLVERCSLGAAVRERARYTGYLGGDRSTPAAVTQAPAEAGPGRRLALCMVGGGEDGYALAQAFARAPMPPATDGMVITGPLMPTADRRRLRRIAGRDVEVVDFLPVPDPVLDRADVVVAMGGYNTVCELLAREKRALIVPRVVPRVEQLIRSQCLGRRGLVDVLHPSRADAAAVGDWLAEPPPAPRVRAAIDLDGLRRLPALLDAVLDGTSAQDADVVGHAA
jgi:predicted glycosyltransferase